MPFKQRLVKIKNFRNIAVNQEDDCELLLNSCFGEDKKDWGDLVILIGPNNAGKSNVLDSLYLCNREQDFDAKDITDYTYGKVKAYPEINFIYQPCHASSDTDKVVYQKVMVDKSTKCETKLIRPNDFKRKELSETENNFILALVKKLNALYPVSKSSYGTQPKPLPKEFARADLDKYLKGDFTDIKYEYIEKLYNFLTNSNNLPSEFASYSSDELNAMLKELKSKTSYTQAEYDTMLEDNWKIKLRPKILKYEEKSFQKNDFKISIKDLDQLQSKSTLLYNIFSYINFDTNAIMDCTQGVDENIVDTLLDEIEKKIKNDIKSINKSFNTLFPFDGETKYRINISINTANITFSISRENTPLVYSHLSTGFKWFFDFFFNFLIANDLGPGDIVLLDEPCANLHEEGVKQFYAIIKNMAKESGLTFFVVTHRASFINVDFLEEVRQISYKNGSIAVENKFNAVPKQYGDALKPVLSNLVASRNTIFDNRVSVPVFVEGITDYCYFSGYKQVYKSNNANIDFVFLPVEGLKQERVNLLNNIHNLEVASIVLVDGDEIGIKTKVESSKYPNIKAFTLTDINKGFKYVEDLFSTNDRKKFNLGTKGNEEEKGAEKDFNDGVYIKKLFPKDGELEKETLDNFKVVFDFLNDFLEKNEVGFVLKKEFVSTDDLPF